MSEQPEEMKPEPVIKFTPPKGDDERGDEKKLSPDSNKKETNLDSHSDMDENEFEAHLSSEGINSRRVSFSESVNFIQESTEDHASSATSPTPAAEEPRKETSEKSAESIAPAAGTVGVNKVHPATEAEGIYLGKPVVTEDDSLDSPTRLTHDLLDSPTSKTNEKSS